MNTHWKKLQSFAETVRIDPYLLWAQESDPVQLQMLLQSQRIPLLLELNIPASQLATGNWGEQGRRQGNEWKRWLRIPNVYAHPSTGLEKTTFCTAIITGQFFEQLSENDALRRAIKRFQFGLPVGPLSRDKTFPTRVAALDRPIKVVTGVIDDALAFAHERFRRSDGSTRVEYFWDQDGPLNNVPGVLYGREHTGAEITSSMNANRHAAMVDEDAVYRALRAEDYTLATHKGLGRRGAHGTHVMDIACGLDPADPQTENMAIIGVQLPGRTVRDTSGAFLWPQVYDGLRYILDRAQDLAAATGSGPLPVAVNLSYGAIAGPHNGSSPLEAGIDELIRLRTPTAPLEVVLPSGNNYLSRCHAQVKLKTGEQQSLTWRILPDGKTPSFLEIWLPNPDALGSRKVKVWVTTATGYTSPPIVEGDHYVWQPKLAVLCDVAYVASPASGDRPLIQVSVAATATLDPLKEIAPCGGWRIKIQNIGPEASIDAWIQRNDTPFGWPILGRQSRFDDPNYVRFDSTGKEREDDDPTSYVKRAGSINALATGQEPPVIGGFRRSDYGASSYSGAGPIVRVPGVPAWRDGPDATAVADDSVVLRGILAAGTRTGSIMALDGTSVAAPQVTRLISQWMLNGLASNRAAVRTFAQLNDPAPPLPKNRGGEGRIEVAPRIKR
jgi:hypothetical protein